MNFLKKASAYVGGLFASAVTTVAVAQSSYDPITTAVDWAEVGTAIIGIFAAIAGVYVLVVGGKKLVSAIRGA